MLSVYGNELYCRMYQYTTADSLQQKCIVSNCIDNSEKYIVTNKTNDCISMSGVTVYGLEYR